MLSALLLSLVLTADSDPGSLVVTCDCNFGLWLDGVEMNTGNIRNNARADNVGPGRHAVKIDSWTSPFHHEVIYDGYVDVPPGSEVRAKASKGKLEVFGQAALAPPAPAFDAGKFNELLGEAVDYVKEAQEANEDDDDSKCTTKVGGKLEALRDLLKDLRHEPSKAIVRKAQKKLQDAQELADDKCSKKIAKKIDKKLDKASSRLTELARLAP